MHTRIRSSGGRSLPPATFYYDLGSPYAYLAAERISGLFAEAGPSSRSGSRSCSAALFKRFGRGLVGQRAGTRRRDRARSSGAPPTYGLPPLAWPEPWPGNTLFAMRAATFAKQIGRTVSFALAAFRQAFAAGRDLPSPTTC